MVGYRISGRISSPNTRLPVKYPAGYWIFCQAGARPYTAFEIWSDHQMVGSNIRPDTGIFLSCRILHLINGWIPDIRAYIRSEYRISDKISGRILDFFRRAGARLYILHLINGRIPDIRAYIRSLYKISGKISGRILTFSSSRY